MFPALYQLWPIVAVLYLVDCLVLLAADHVLLWAPPSVAGKRGRFRRTTGSLRLLPPWPNVRAYRVHEIELVSTADALHVLRPGATGAARLDPAGYDRVAWPDVARAEADHHWLRLPGIRPLRLPAPAHARALEVSLRRRAKETESGLRNQSESTGSVAAAQRHGPEAIGQHLAALARRLRTARRGSWVSSLLVLIALPIALYVLHSPRLSSWVAFSGACALAFTAGVSVRAVRRIGRAGLAETTGVLFPLLLSPPNLLRAGDALALDLLQGFDSWTLTAHLLPADRALPVLRQRFHAAAFAATQGDDAGWKRWWRVEGERVLALAQACSLSEAQLRRAPVLDDPSATAFCPHCQGAYRDTATLCGDCRLPLIPAARP